MPRDSGGTFSLVSGYLAVTGQPIEASQHNPPLEDVATALTGSLPRNGSAGMQANLAMAGFKVTGMANGTAADDAVTKSQLDGVASVASTINAATAKTPLVDGDRFAITDSAASYVIKRVTWDAIKSTLKTYFDGLYSSISHTHTVTEGGSWLVPAPSNKSYTLALKMPFAGTITETTTKSTSGTCTATFKINSTALGGTANAVSSVEQSVTQSSANAFVAGDDLVVTVSANSACVDALFAIKWTRTV